MIVSEAKDTLKLGGVDFDSGFGPDYIVSLGDFCLDWELRPDALVDLFRGPTPLQQALTLGSRRTSDANGSVQFSFSIRLEKQRDHHYGHRFAFSCPGGHLCLPQCSNPGM